MIGIPRKLMGGVHEVTVLAMVPGVIVAALVMRTPEVREIPDARHNPSHVGECKICCKWKQEKDFGEKVVFRTVGEVVDRPATAFPEDWRLFPPGSPSIRPWSSKTVEASRCFQNASPGAGMRVLRKDIP